MRSFTKLALITGSLAVSVEGFAQVQSLTVVFQNGSTATASQQTTGNVVRDIQQLSGSAQTLAWNQNIFGQPIQSITFTGTGPSSPILNSNDGFISCDVNALFKDIAKNAPGMMGEWYLGAFPFTDAQGTCATVATPPAAQSLTVTFASGQTVTINNAPTGAIFADVTTMLSEVRPQAWNQSIYGEPITSITYHGPSPVFGNSSNIDPNFTSCDINQVFANMIQNHPDYMWESNLPNMSFSANGNVCPVAN